MSLIVAATLFLLLALGFLSAYSVKIVPEQEVWIIERLGKYYRKLQAGLNFISPFTDKISYKHSLKEEAIDVHQQTAITQDNVSVLIDGILYIKIVDPIKASYGAKNPQYALTQLAQTTMRSEIGKLPLDKCFEDRLSLNAHIVHAMNDAAASWGIACLRYEIKDIIMPADIKKAMELQMTAERQKRAKILESEGLKQAEINESEGKRQAQINIAESTKQKMILESEAALTDKINRAKGKAEAIRIVAAATAQSIEVVSLAVQKKGGDQATALRVAEQYIDAFKELAQKGTTVLLPADASNAGVMIAQALSIFDAVKTKKNQPNQIPSGMELLAKGVEKPTK
jgi:regulator of protease activity HflC (stomatin/prohibitin superfamily)